MRTTAAPVFEGEDPSRGALAALDVTVLQERIYRAGLVASGLRWAPLIVGLIVGARSGIAATIAADAPIAQMSWYLPFLGYASVELPAALFRFGLLGLAAGTALSTAFRWVRTRQLRPSLQQLETVDRGRVLKPICNVGGEAGRIVDRLIADLRLDRYRLEVAASDAPGGRGDEVSTT